MPSVPQRTSINAPIHVESIILYNVIGATSKVEITGGLISIYIGVEVRIMAMQMRHPQSSTLLELDDVEVFGMLTK